MTSMIQRQETLIRATSLASRATPVAREAEDDIQQQTPTPENKCRIATKQHRAVQKETLHQHRNTNSLRDAKDNTTHVVFEGELAVKLHTSNVEVGTSANGNHRQDQVTMGGLTVLDLLTTKAFV